jgi:shikimate dehydrogenase
VRLYFAVIGERVREYSASPAMHSASFRALGIDAEYIAIDVPREELACFARLARWNFRGFNVTMPHKEEIVRYLDSLSEEAGATGAVNTVAVEGGVMTGYNTDAQALLGLAGRYMEGADVLVLGAGGAARAAVYAAITARARAVYVANRTEGRAVALARKFSERFGCEVRAVPWGARVRAAVVINATPVHDAVIADLSGASLYIDLVYAPSPRTRMVEEAGRLGIKVIDGVDVLVEQGALAERVWLGVEPDRGVMREAVLKFLRAQGAL